jgi:hypothetical protein
MRKYFSKMTLALVVALVMSLGIAGVAMADPGTPEPPRELVNVGITKVLDIPEGTTVPASNFQFTFQQMIPNPDGEGLILGSTAPAATIAPATAGFAAGNAGGFVTAEDPHFPVTQAVNVLRPQAGTSWPHAGDFFFLVTETASTNGFTPPEHMSYSTASWVLIVRVANVTLPDGTVELRPVQAYAVAPTRVPGTDGTPDSFYYDEEGKRQVTPGTPGTPDTEQEGQLLDPSAIRFVNVFTRDIIGVPADPALAVSKTLSGEFADMTRTFSFSGTLVIPAAAVERVGGEVTAIVVDANGIAVVPERTVVFSGADGTLTGTFTLGHGETLAFPTVTAGTTFNFTETQLENWSGTAVITSGSSAPVTVGEIAQGNAGEDVITGVHIVSDARGPEADSGFLGNTAAFHNAFHESPLTGLVIGSMPFLAVLLGATLLLAMMVASRSRQRIEQIPNSY